MSDLSESQQAALDELQQITAAEDPDRELAVLRSVNWNVEVRSIDWRLAFYALLADGVIGTAN